MDASITRSSKQVDMLDIRVDPETVVGGLTGDQFKLAFRNHAAGVALVTADDGRGPVAMTVTSAFSISAEPPLLVFSASAFSSSTPTLMGADTLVLHLLGADQQALAKLGATSGVDRFADTSAWSRLPTGEPYYLAVSTWIRGRVVARISAGTSTLFVVHALETTETAVDAANDTRPLVYHNRTWHQLADQSRLD